MTSHIHPWARVGGAPEARGFDPETQTVYAPDIHATARVSAFCTVDAGLFRHTKLGARSWILQHVHLGHDAQVGEDCEIATGTVVGGEVTIGDRVKVGINATIRPCVSIGDDARVGCGAVVVADVEPGVTVVGNPAHVLEHGRQTDAHLAEADMAAGYETLPAY